MDDENKQLSQHNNAPGAPEIDAMPAEPTDTPKLSIGASRFRGPVFRADPEPPKPVAVTPSPASSNFDDDLDIPQDVFDDVDDDDDGPERPPALDERQQKLERMQGRPHKSKRDNTYSAKKVAIIVALVLLIVGAVTVSVFFWFNSSRPAKPKATPQPAVTQPTPVAETPVTEEPETTEPEPVTEDPVTEEPQSSEPKEYTSEKLKMTVTHPGDWTVNETSTKLTITSPIVQITSAGGGTVSGRMVYNARPQQANPAEFAAGEVVAVMDSKAFNYTKPSANQRDAAHLSFLQYESTETKGGMDGVYITSSYAYKYAQKVTTNEIKNVRPLIHLSFVKCADAACEPAQQSKLTVSSSAWKSDSVNRPVAEAILKSLYLN